MANRNNRQQAGGNRRMDFGRVDRKGYGRPMPVSPWQQGGPSAPMGNLLPLASSSEATLALANNLISNLLQARQTTVPSLLDMPIRRDFGGDPNRGFDRGFNRMGNQPNFRRGPGNYVRPSDRPNFTRKNFKANDGQKKQFNKKDAGDSKPKQAKPAESAVAKEPETKESEVKEEAKDASAQDNAKDESTAADGDSAADADAENAEGEKKEGDKKGGLKTAYDGIKSALLHCHICNKVMWDGRSFENHVNGRAHHIMMQKTAESYALTADTMRQELKIREMKHYRKQGQNVPRNFFCTMCDMYAADGAAHRTTIGHRKLKKYLHPACTSCHKEMPTRIELDEHRLTPEHLLSVQGRRKDFTTKPKTEAMVISTLAMEESYIRFDRKDGKRSAGDKDKDKDDKDKDDKDKEEKDDEEVKEEQEGGEATEETPAEENLVLDWKEGDDVTDITNEMIPKYEAERGVGRSFLTEFTCMQCTLCRKLLDSPETAEVHLRTWRHHLLFVKHLQRKSKPEDVQNELKRTSADEEEDDSSSSSKRRKMTSTDGEGATNGDHHEEEGGEGEETGAAEEGEGEGEDVEMSEEQQDQQNLWDNEVQVILDDADEQKQVEKPEPVEEEAPVEPEPVATPSKAKATRGRGRGRGRGARGSRT